METWAIIKVKLWTFRLRPGKAEGEPLVVVEPLEGNISPVELSALTTLANADYKELALKYVPSQTLAVAEILARNLHGEIVDYSAAPKYRSAADVSDPRIAY